MTVRAKIFFSILCISVASFSIYRLLQINLPRCNDKAVVDLVKDISLKPLRQFAPSDKATEERFAKLKDQLSVSGIRDRGKDDSGKVRNCAAQLSISTEGFTMPDSNIVYTIELTETQGEIYVTVRDE